MNLYFAILNTVISLVRDQFNHLQEINSKFGFLYYIDELGEKPTQSVLDHCVKLERALTHSQSKDIDTIELCHELQSIYRRITKQSTPMVAIDFILQYDLEENVPDFYMAFWILLMLPITVTSGERSFPKRLYKLTSGHPWPKRCLLDWQPFPLNKSWHKESTLMVCLGYLRHN